MTERIEYNGKIWNIPVVYTDDIEYDWAAGVFTGSEIRIRPRYKGRKGILEHEKEHALQLMINVNHMFNYAFDKEYRYDCEIKAYCKTIKYNGYTDVSQIEWIVDSMINNYNVDKTKDEVVADLSIALNDRIKLKSVNTKPLYAFAVLMALIAFFITLSSL